MLRVLRIAVLVAASAGAAAADDVCVSVRTADADGDRKYEIWLEKGALADFTYAWTCEVATSNASSEVSNSTYALRKPDQDDKLGACSATIEPETTVKITIDLSTAPSPFAQERPKALDTMNFAFDPAKESEPARGCRTF